MSTTQITNRQAAAIAGGFLAMVAIGWYIWHVSGHGFEATHNGIGNAIIGTIVIASGLMLFFAPTMIAIHRKHASTGAIVVVNLLGSIFCGIGWIIALIWSLSDPAGKGASVQVVNNVTAQPTYQVGDVVNGHRYNGVEWVSL